MKIGIEEGARRRTFEIKEIPKERATEYFALSLKNGDELYKVFLSMGADPNVNNNEAMKRAIAQNNISDVEILRDYGASLDVDLTEAIQQNFNEVVSYLLNNDAECKQEYVMAAILSKNEDMVRSILLRNKVNVTQEDVREAIKTSSKVAKCVLLYFTGETDFLWQDLKEAIEKADTETTKLLFATLTGSITFRGRENTCKVDCAKLVSNCVDAEKLNEMIKLIKSYKPEILRLDDSDVSEFYKKASMETFKLLEGIVTVSSHDEMLIRAGIAGNKKLAIEIMQKTDVNLEKVFKS